MEINGDKKFEYTCLDTIGNYSTIKEKKDFNTTDEHSKCESKKLCYVKNSFMAKQYVLLHDDANK